MGDAQQPNCKPADVARSCRTQLNDYQNLSGTLVGYKADNKGADNKRRDVRGPI
jgi:hypothetical protein